MTEPTPRGFNCTTCNRFWEFNSWVAAHAMYRVNHLCLCGARHEVINYSVKLITPGVKDGPFQD